MRYLGLGCGLALLAALAAPAPTSAATIAYLNRCAGSCTFTQGTDDAVANTSSVFTGTRQLSAFAHGDASFIALTACVGDLLAPFDIVVTTTDPSPAAHSEIVVAGTTLEAGVQVGLSGIAPFNCGYFAGAPVFAFANSIGNDVTAICVAAAAQLASSAGLEPLFSCPDVMSFLNGCGPKRFRDDLVACGGFQATTCQCGGTQRNSYLAMRSVFGAANRAFANGFESPL